ncbi:MAG TPA: DUF4097 family beta strand repeat-containing protein [Candidatus Baltobacteraceae bacterium]|nr:DUF4097 family beta strand repeat-containing protein [Candidatus Baltobacteraceae bacterium]
MFLVLALAAVPFTYDGTMHRGGRLEITDVNGSIRVHTGDRFHIRAEKHGTHSDPSQVAIRVETHGDTTVVCVRYPPDQNAPCDAHESTHDNDVEVDFDVEVPHGIALTARSVNGNVEAQNDGPIDDIASVNGNVRAEGTEVERIETVNGNIDAHVVGSRGGSLEAKTVNGELTVTLPGGSGARVTAKTLNGDIRVGLPVSRPQFGPGASVNGTVGNGAYDLRLNSLNGSITLRR